MQVIVHRDLEQLEAIREAWNRLTDANEAHSAFQRYEWAISWWRVYDRRLDLFVAGVYDNGRLIGVAPWFRKPILSWGNRPGWIVRFLADALSDYCTILAEPGREDEVFAALAGYLATHPAEWKVLRLLEMPGPDAERWARHAREAGLRLSRVPGSKTFVVPVRSGWEAYFRSLTGRMRKKYERPHPLLAKHVRTVFVPGSGITPAIVRELEELNRQSPEAKWAGSLFLQPDLRAFHLEHLWQSSFRDFIMLQLVYVGPKLAAYNYNLRMHGRIYDYNCNFNEVFGKLAVGNYAKFINVRYAFDHGLDAYDFLRGEYLFKKRFNPVEQRNTEVRLYRGRVMQCWFQCWRRVYELGKAVYVRWVLPTRRGVQTAASGVAVAMRYLRKRGVLHALRTAGKVAARWLLVRGSLLIVAVEPAAAVAAGVRTQQSREITIADYPELEALVGAARMTTMVNRFAAGDRCWGTLCDGAVCAATWITEHPQLEETFDIPVALQPRELYMYDSFVSERCRGRGLMRQAVAALLSDPQVRRASRLFALVEPGNAPMLASLRPLGFRAEARIDRCKILLVCNSWRQRELSPAATSQAAVDRPVRDSETTGV